MDCRAIKKLLPASVDHQLTADDQRRVDEHVQSCASCRAELADLRATVAHLQNIEQIVPPPWMTQKIMARIRADEQPSKSFWERLFGAWPMKVPLGALATVMLTVFIIVIFRSIQPELTHDAVQDTPKQTAPVPEATLRKEAAPAVSKPEAVPESRRAKAERAVPSVPPAPEAADKKGASPALAPIAGASAPAAEQATQVRKQEAESLKESERYEKSDAAEGMIRPEAKKAKKPAPSPAMRSAAPRAPAVPGITVIVGDAESASGQIRASVQNLGGRVVSIESSAADRQVITVELSPDKLPDLREQLKGLGQVTEHPVVADDKVSVRRIRIEILRVQ